ncbi:MAG: DNA translocase FtsK 4TM domain-containing protein [Nitrospinota bacterium]
MGFVKNVLRHSIFKEAAGIFWIAFSILVVISLVSYDPFDPSFSHAVSEKSQALNYAGIVGAYLSDAIIQLIGSAGFALPVIALALGLLLFRSEPFSFVSSLLGGGALFLVSSCAFIFIFWPIDPYYHYADVPGGGILGKLIAGKFLVKFLAKPGAAIVALTVFFISFLIVMRLSATEFVLLVKDAAAKAYRAAVEAATALLGKFRILAGAISQFGYSLKVKAAEVIGSDAPKIIEPPTLEDENPTIVKKTDEDAKKKPDGNLDAEQFTFNFVRDMEDYTLPPLSYLSDPKQVDREESDKQLLVNSQILSKKLEDFGIEGKVTTVSPGPVITLYEFEPAAGVKVSRIVGLADDLAMGLRAVAVRILAPVPGKAVVGIEVPNARVEPVGLKQILVSDEFVDSQSTLTMALGKSTSGVPVVTDLSRIPHILMAGATGSGKSVGLNSMIMSILYKATPAEVNFIMIDPKMLELSVYDGIPHLIAPVVTNPKKAANALQWAVSEMERRYKVLADRGFRNISGYNAWVIDQLEEEEKNKKKPKKKAMEDEADVQAVTYDEDGPLTDEGEDEEKEPLKPLPYIVVVIDELADLMMVASKDVEMSLARLAQMARASGIHLIVATQRPSVDVLTGLIKANFPARISFQVSSRVDSRTILDTIGAEKLLGKGDMLFLPPGTSRLQRIHGPFVSDDEVKRAVTFLKKQGRPIYDENILKAHEKAVEAGAMDGDEVDEEYFEQAVELVADTRQASISMVQRRLRIGYNRAARIIETMEAKGMVGPADGAKPRQVFIPPSMNE